MSDYPKSSKQIIRSIMPQTTVYLSLGGNQDDTLSRLKQALDVLSCQKDIHDLQISHFYRTAPLQVESSNCFVNAVCRFQTFLTLQDIFQTTQTIEIQFGKVKKPKHASRPIDIDILFYGNQACQEGELEIPHPRWKERLFVLVPLADLTQDILLQRESEQQHYTLKDLIQLLSDSFDQTISILEKNPYLQ